MVVLSRIFGGFFSTREEGTGVGLAFCFRMICGFDADLDCESEPGGYT
jgi:signal transduction histidine kinase